MGANVPGAGGYMKKLLILPFLVLLTGCVSYYYPETALEDGVYYAEDDPSYVVYQGGYPGASYYPWSSMDYFYMGYYPGPYYAHCNGYSYGFSCGYSPWHYPNAHYGYYSALYASYYHYPFYPVWRPYGGHCSLYGSCGRGNHDYRGNGHDRLVGKGRNRDDSVVDDDAVFDDDLLPNDLVETPGLTNGTSNRNYARYVSAMPSGFSGNRGMVIRSSETTKIGKSRVQPNKPGPTSTGIVIVAQPSQPLLTSANSAGNRPSTPTSNTGRTTARSSATSASRSFSSPRSGVSSRSSGRSRSGSSSRVGRSSRSSIPQHTQKKD
jgi:hypothetical protein